MNNDLISRSALLEKAWDADTRCGYVQVVDVGDIEDAPAVDAEPVVYCSWVTELDDMGWKRHTCLNCGYVKRTDIHVSLGWNYCPKCGANMVKR